MLDYNIALMNNPLGFQGWIRTNVANLGSKPSGPCQQSNLELTPSRGVCLILF